ncbi:hypothetical protein LXL04_036618 [Taraxacum kok-saghyz]
MKFREAYAFIRDTALILRSSCGIMGCSLILKQEEGEEVKRNLAIRKPKNHQIHVATISIYQRQEKAPQNQVKLLMDWIFRITRGVNEPSRARIPPSSARARLSCCRLELELGSFKVWYPSSSSAREKCKKLELGSARLVYLSSLNEPRLGSSSFMLFELD